MIEGASPAGPPGNETVSFIPYVSDAFTRKINKILKQLGLPIVLRARGGVTLLEIYGSKPKPLVSKNPPQCCPTQADADFWMWKNVVYNIICLECPTGTKSDYIGQTGGTAESRIKTHAGSTRAGRTDSALAQHYAEVHPDNCQNPKFEVKILDRPRDPAHRLISEAILIHQRKPALNVKYESGSSQNVELYIDQTIEQREVALRNSKERYKRQQNTNTNTN